MSAAGAAAFVGRESELGQIAAALGAAAAGRLGRRSATCSTEIKEAIAMGAFTRQMSTLLNGTSTGW